MNKIAIIGLSNFGINLAEVLAKKKKELLLVDVNINKVNSVKDIATKAVAMDATKVENLEALGLADYDLVVVSTGPEFESSIIIVHLLKERLKLKNIMAKANSMDHQKILELIGANDVLFPERDMAIKVGNRLSSSILLDYLPLESDFLIQEIAAPDQFIGKTLAQIHLRKKYDLTVIAIRSIIPEKTHLNPSGDFLIKETDLLIILGSQDKIEQFHKQFS
jgi:trk system potassium uptake protein TrkA